MELQDEGRRVQHESAALMGARPRLLANVPELLQEFPRIAAKYADFLRRDSLSGPRGPVPERCLAKKSVLPVSTMIMNRLH